MIHPVQDTYPIFMRARDIEGSFTLSLSKLRELYARGRYDELALNIIRSEANTKGKKEFVDALEADNFLKNAQISINNYVSNEKSKSDARKLHMKASVINNNLDHQERADIIQLLCLRQAQAMADSASKPPAEGGLSESYPDRWRRLNIYLRVVGYLRKEAEKQARQPSAI